MPLKSGQLKIKWTAEAKQPHAGTAPKDSGKGKFSQNTELWAGHLIVYFAWKDKCSEVQVDTNLWAIVNIWLEGQKFGKNPIEKLVTEL